ncbi:CD177 antigen-like [Apodemus sylvaticus]|uniref:CD177 antigen-like n=1 Tax=Apodemus sylvaticus TaxID=10129 RepID=UPI0022428C17|nr:CD177 antigen-like [Apodemus sylvaticus]
MGACRIQYVLLLSLLGFSPCSDTLTCQDGSMMKFGKNFTKEAVEWRVDTTAIMHGNTLMCQETLLLIDIGEKSVIMGSKGISKVAGKSRDVKVYSTGPGIVAASYVHFCDTNGCNRANSTSVLLDSLSLSGHKEPGSIQCPACLDFKGSCNLSAKLVFCPKDTKCYAGSLALHGGSLSTYVDIVGCLNSSYQFLLSNQSTIGIIDVKETLEPMSSNSFSHVLVLSSLLAWMFGLSPLLSPLFAEICPLC